MNTYTLTIRFQSEHKPISHDIDSSTPRATVRTLLDDCVLALGNEAVESYKLVCNDREVSAETLDSCETVDQWPPEFTN